MLHPELQHSEPLTDEQPVLPLGSAHDPGASPLTTLPSLLLPKDVKVFSQML